MRKVSSHEHLHDHHNGHEREPVISKRWKWATVLGNAAIGACELAMGNTSTLAVTSDGLHNVGDTVTYYMQAENILNPDKSEARRRRSRKIAHWIIATSSLAIGAKAGIDLALDHESTPDPGTIYAAGTSLALNGFLLHRLRKGMRAKKARQKSCHVSSDEHDLSKHFWAVDMPSAGLALGGAVLQRYNVDIEQVAAMASGMVGAYAFRPTEANLSHNCLDHHTAKPAHTHRHRKKSWREQMRYKPRHERMRQPSRLKKVVVLGSAALALTGGLLSGDTQGKHSKMTQDTPPFPEQYSRTITPEDTSDKSEIPIMDCEVIQPGDSQWKIAKKRLTIATGDAPNAAATNAVMLIAAHANKATLSSPHTINPGDCLWVPTLEATQKIDEAVDAGPHSGSRIAVDIETINSYSTIHSAIEDNEAFNRLSTELSSVAGN